MSDTNVNQLIINELTKAQYEALTPASNQLYLVTDEVPLDSSTKYGANLNYSNSQLQLKDQDGNNLGNAVTIESSPSTDNETISLNTDQELQAIAVKDNNGNALKTWTGTKAQYDAIVTKDNNTLYNITDDTDVTLALLQTIYPVGATYFTQNNTCPLSALFGTWQLQASTTLVTSVSASSTTPVKGNGIALGLTNGSVNVGISPSTTADLCSYTGLYNQSVGTSPTGLVSTISSLGITTDATKSGIIADTSNLLTSTTINMNIFVRIA